MGKRSVRGKGLDLGLGFWGKDYGVRVRGFALGGNS